MGELSRDKRKYLIDNLIKESSCYQIMQLMRIAECYNKKAIVIPVKEMIFPTTDVASILVSKNTIKICSTYFGLYGVDSPLPTFMSQAATYEDDDGERYRALLDIINIRIYHLLYEAWKKSKIVIDFELNKNWYINIFKKLSGNLLENERNRTLSFSGVIGHRSKNLSMLKAVITDFFIGSDVSIQSFLGRWVEISNQLILGNKQSSIGINSVLGRHVYDYNASLLIRIKTNLIDRLIKIKKNRLKMIFLHKLIRHYIDANMHFSLQIHICLSSELKTLGNSSHYLGWNTILGTCRQAMYKKTLKLPRLED